MKKKRLTRDELEKLMRGVQNPPKIKMITTDEGREYFVFYQDREGTHAEEDKTD